MSYNMGRAVSRQSMAPITPASNYPFPILSFSQIINQMQKYSISLTRKDLEQPNRSIVIEVLDAFSFSTIGLEIMDFVDIPDEDLQQIEEPDMIVSFRSVWLFAKALKEFFHRIHLPDFDYTFIALPTGKKFQLCLSALLAYMRHFELFTDTVKDKIIEKGELIRQRDSLDEKLENLDNEFNDKRRRREENDVVYELLKIEDAEMEDKAQEQANQCNILAEANDKIKAQHNQVKERISTIKEKLQSDRTRLEELNALIDANPTLLRQTEADSKSQAEMLELELEGINSTIEHKSKLIKLYSSMLQQSQGWENPIEKPLDSFQERGELLEAIETKNSELMELKQSLKELKQKNEVSERVLESKQEFRASIPDIQLKQEQSSQLIEKRKQELSELRHSREVSFRKYKESQDACVKLDRELKQYIEQTTEIINKFREPVEAIINGKAQFMKSLDSQLKKLL